MSPEDYEKLDYVYRTKAEVQTMLVTALEQERQKIYQQGQAEGIAAQRQTLLRFIQWRFHTSEEQQAKLAQQLAQIDNLAKLTQLSEIFLQAGTLEEFIQQLATYLPTRKN